MNVFAYMIPSDDSSVACDTGAKKIDVLRGQYTIMYKLYKLICMYESLIFACCTILDAMLHLARGF